MIAARDLLALLLLGTATAVAMALLLVVLAGLLVGAAQGLADVRRERQ